VSLRFTETLGAANVNTGIAQIKLGRTLLREQHLQEAEEHTLAGYDNLNHQTDPGTSFLQAARKDLVAEYEGLRMLQQSQRFQAELTAHSSSR
jgi:serine/threonine-protein kinase